MQEVYNNRQSILFFIYMKIRNAISKHSKGYLVPTITSYWHTIRLAAFYTPDVSLANSSIHYLENEISND